MTRTRKVAVSVGILALLLGAGINMQVSALTPKALNSTVIQKGLVNPKQENINRQVSPEDDKTSIKVKNVEIWIDGVWNPEDNFVSSTYGLGYERPFREVTVEGYVDTKTAGVYYVTYSVHNCAKKKIGAKAMVKVKKDLTSIVVKDSTIKIGDIWKAEDNYIRATSVQGKGILFKEVMISGTVNTTKSGVYQVAYSVPNGSLKKLTARARITVKGNSSEKGEGKGGEIYIKVKDSEIYLGDKWGPADNFVSASDEKGRPTPFEDITLEGHVDATKAGSNWVRYYINDSVIGKHMAQATAMVMVWKDQTDLKLKDSTIYVGDQWQANDNYLSGKNARGNKVDIANVIVSGSINTKKPGINKIIYAILDHNKKAVSKEAIIEVKANQANLAVKDSMLNRGDKWQAADNLVKAISSDGKTLDIKDIDVKGSVDTHKAGNNEVVYSVIDGNGKKITKKANVMVKDKADHGIGGGAGSGTQLPKTGYDISIVAALVGLAALLGVGSIYLKLHQQYE